MVGKEGGNVHESSFRKLNKTEAVDMRWRLVFPVIVIDEFNRVTTIYR